MPRLRLFLIMLLTVALDLSPAAPPPHAMAEVAAEESEDATRAQRHRRAVRHVRDTTAPSIAPAARDARPHRARWRAPVPSRREQVTDPIRKLPPAAAETSSAPEDH